MAPHPVVRRGLALFSGSFALLWITLSMMAGAAPAAYVALSGRLADAGYAFAVFSLAAASGSFLGGRAMDRWGRRPVLASAHVLAAAGYGVAGAGFLAASLVAFIAGLSLLAAGSGALYLTRLAAAELFPLALRGRGMATVQVSATVGAVVGPLLLVASGPLGALLGRSPDGLVWFLAPPLLLAAAILVLLAPEPVAIARDLARYHPDAPADPPAAGPGATAPRRVLLTGVAALALAQAAMVAVMGVTGAAMKEDGHALHEVGWVMTAHFLGMFALSLLVGRMADRVGRRATLLAGFAVLAAGGTLLATVAGVPALAAGLFVVGLGWSFAYISGTVLLTDVTPLPRRARVLGAADLSAALLAATAATVGGWWYAARGFPGLGWFAVALVVIPAALAFALREKRPGVYGSVDGPPGEAPATARQS